jgi:GAF domain-containing protein
MTARCVLWRRMAEWGRPGVRVLMVYRLPEARVTGRAFLDRQTIHVADLAAALEGEFPESISYQKELGFRTTLATPLLSKNIPIGVILIHRMAVSPFSSKQIAMLETFASQAVITIAPRTASCSRDDRLVRERLQDCYFLLRERPHFHSAQE